MSLAENLLNSLDETAHENMRIAGSGEEEHIIVGQDRSITVPNALKTIAVEGDKDVETATIDCVRYWDGHDLSTFAIYLNYILPNGDEGTYIPKGISKAEDTFSFDWLIGSEFTYAQGKMTFWIVAKLTDDSGTLIKQWSSFQNSDCTIAQGGDKIYVPEKQTDQDVISQAISISRASAEAANKAALDAREAAEDEVTRLVGELGVVQAPGKSPTSVVSQAVTTALYNRNAKRITNLEQGVAEQFETDASVAYVKDVPANALPYAEIKKIGGMTYKDGNTLKSAKVTEVKSVGVNLIPFPYSNTTKTINGVTFTVKNDGTITINGTATKAIEFFLNEVKCVAGESYRLSGCPSGGGANTYILFDNAKFVGNGTTFSFPETTMGRISIFIVQGVTVSNVTFKPMLKKGTTDTPYKPFVKHNLHIPAGLRPANGINENVYDYIEWAEDGSQKQVVRCGVVDLGTLDWALGLVFYAFIADKKGTYNVIADNYDTFIGDVYDLPNKSLTINKVHGDLLYIKDTEYTDAAAFKAAMSGVMLVYELAEPIITDISNLITADNLIGVEGGGTLTFENEYGYAVPSEVEYQVEV